MNTVTPASLPEIDAIEIVDLRGVAAERVDDYMNSSRTVLAWRLAGTDAERIAVLWRSLPAGEQMRCHVPPFGFRFFARQQLVAEASVCWRCNNLFGWAGDRELFFEFDSSSPAARDLLAAAEKATGISVTG